MRRTPLNPEEELTAAPQLGRRHFLQAAAALAATPLSAQSKPRSFSGIYPHLAMFNGDNECGTGALALWAGKLWVVTYSPHRPYGSDDGLYEVDANLKLVRRPESIGGTPANRFLHVESQQLFMGPYAIDKDGRVRVIPYSAMPGRPTGNARHLTDPASKIYYASMEEGFYEVDVKSLAVRLLYEDGNEMTKRDKTISMAGPLLPGYHGKGAYSGQGVLVYANNGEIGGGLLPPSTPSGCLAEWDGKDWKVVRRNQFTEVTGPGGLSGNPKPATDPIWSIGWDYRSLILMTRTPQGWQSHRLPKASHSYDGAHGWNTEWPRIRDIGERDLLMTMHGMFWRFPKNFGANSSTGIRPRSSYLKVIADFLRRGDEVVFACDDAAKSEFLNKRRVKGEILGPGQSQSNLWFVAPERIDQLGPILGRGALWIDEPVAANTPSEPYLFAGYERRQLHLAHTGDQAVRFSVETDATGTGQWTPSGEFTLPPHGNSAHLFPANQTGEWLRIRTDQAATGACAILHYSSSEKRTTTPAPLFRGLATPTETDASRGYLWNRDEQKQTLLFTPTTGPTDSVYELLPSLELAPRSSPEQAATLRQKLAPPKDAVMEDAASIVILDDAGKRWRFPKGPAPLGHGRKAREVSTERDLLHLGGIFYELPANNAGGIPVARPVAAHSFAIEDFMSHRGMLVLSGISPKAMAGDHIIRSADGRAALWLGVFDDLWQLGRPRGDGGPWNNSPVTANTPSDPYIFTGFEHRDLTLSHTSSDPVRFLIELDLTGTGLWKPYQSFSIPAGKPLTHRFPLGYGAYWIRVTADKACKATATLRYR